MQLQPSGSETSLLGHHLPQHVWLQNPLQQVVAVAYLIDKTRSGLLLSAEPSPAARAPPPASPVLLLTALPALASGCVCSEALPGLDSSTVPANRKDGLQLPPVLLLVMTLNTRLTPVACNR